MATQPAQSIPLDHLHVVIRDRVRVLFEGEVKAISSTNEKGPFDVLGEHSNFITLIKEYVTIHKVDGTTQEIKVPNGIMKVIKNDAHIFIGLTATTTTKPQVKPLSILNKKP